MVYNMTSGKKHYRELDIAKGIGIILVVFGHSITQYNNQVSGIWSVIYNFIYSFHMPFFFLISGILSTRLLDKSIQEKKVSIRKKAVRLLVPYFFIGLLFIPINLLLSGI